MTYWTSVDQYSEIMIEMYGLYNIHLKGVHPHCTSFTYIFFLIGLKIDLSHTS